MYYIPVCTCDILVMGLVWAVREDLWRYFGQFGKLEMVQVCELTVFAVANLYSLSLSCTYRYSPHDLGPHKALAS